VGGVKQKFPHFSGVSSKSCPYLAWWIVPHRQKMGKVLLRFALDTRLEFSVAYVSCRMRKLASERGKRVANRRGGGQKCVENREKILNRGNEPKNLLKAKELALSGAENELVFEREKAQTKRKMEPKTWKLEDGNWDIAVEIRVAIFHFRFSSFHFPVSSF
jgi:hypothetical protein